MKSGKVHILCISEIPTEKINNSINILTFRKKADIIIIADADTFHSRVIAERFAQNLLLIKNHSSVKELKLILQFNLEVEIMASLGIQEKKLLEMFSVQGISKLKSAICKQTPTALFTKTGELHDTEFWSCKFHQLPETEFLAKIRPYFSSILGEK